MTLNGAIKQLQDFECAEDLPVYYKPAIAEIVNTLLMDVQEVRHGKWIDDNHRPKCSICGSPIPVRKIIFDGEVMWEDNSSDNYCSACGAKMDLECKDESD